LATSSSRCASSFRVPSTMHSKLRLKICCETATLSRSLFQHVSIEKANNYLVVKVIPPPFTHTPTLFLYVFSLYCTSTHALKRA
jgi:hypothetical protein